MTTDIVQNHSANLVLEDLKTQNLTAKGGSRKRGLNRAILNQSLGEIATQLVYKAESAGGECIMVAPHYTTQQCSNCKETPSEKVPLSQRVYSCEYCGYTEDRDVNAARNICRKGIIPFHRAGLSPDGEAEAVTPVRLESVSAPKSTDIAKNRTPVHLGV